MLDYASNRPCGITSEMLEGVVSPKEFVTLSSKPTSKSSFAPRKYPHTPEQIAKELRVDAAGELWWRRPRRGRKMNRPTGHTKGYEYKRTMLDGTLYLNSAIVWCLYYGRWPYLGMVLDHINHNTLDDRKENLREVSNAENQRNTKGLQINNTSGVTGVCWDKAAGKWLVYLRFDDERIHGGRHESFEDAVAARQQLEIDYGIADYAVMTVYTSPKPKTLDSISTFQQVKL